jgi:hypothetical protein
MHIGSTGDQEQGIERKDAGGFANSGKAFSLPAPPSNKSGVSIVRYDTYQPISSSLLRTTLSLAGTARTNKEKRQ